MTGSSNYNDINLDYSQERGKYTNLDPADFRHYLDEIDTFFLHVGFPKTATTTIAHLLAKQDSVQMSRHKEPYFFASDEYQYGPGFYWEKYFDQVWDGEPVVGEANTPNSYTPFTAKRISETIPDAKIIFSLRNPIDRAFSDWWMFYRSGLEDLSFDEAIKWELVEQRNDLMPLDAEEDDYWKWHRRRILTENDYIRHRTPRTYLMRGHYAEHIKRFKKYFDEDDILYVFQDRLYNNRQSELDRIGDFLGLKHEFQDINWDGHVSPKHPLHGWISNKVLPKQSQIPDHIIKFGRAALNVTTNIFPKKVKIDDDIHDKLSDYYRDKNKELEQIVDRDLSHWNKSTRY